jgi:hypothetical protein
MSADIERLRDKLIRSRELERVALTRLRRAQTLFEKHYSNSNRIQDNIEIAEHAANRMAARLLHEVDNGD